MADRAQVEIHADITALRKELQGAKDDFGSLNQAALKAGPAMQRLEDGSEAAMGSLAALRQEAEHYRNALAKLDPESKQFATAAKALNTVLERQTQVQKQAADAGSYLHDSMKKTSGSAGALSIAMGVLGATSIQGVIMKTIQLTGESLRLAVNLAALESRAKAIFGDSFPRMQEEAESLSVSLKRSSSALLEFMTGFAQALGNFDLAPSLVRDLSTELSVLTVTLGKAFPDKSDIQIYEILSSAIEGNMRGLRSLGIVLNDKILQDFAEKEGIALKVSAMDLEQKAYLTTQFLLKETTELQLAAADATGKLGDASKTTKDKWQDLQELVGTGLGPAFAAGINNAIEMIQGLVTMIQIATMAAQTMFSVVQNTVAALADPGSIGMFGDNTFTDQTNALNASASLDRQNQMKAAQANLRRQTTGSGVASSAPEADPLKDFWRDKSDAAGAGGKKAEDAALDRAKTLLTAIQNIEKGISDEQNKQINANRTLMTAKREELMLKQRLGTITKEESRELETINRRVDFGKDKVKDATAEWDKQTDRVKNLRGEVEKLNDGIVEEHKRLQDTLAGIDQDAKRRKESIQEDAQKSRVEKIADLIKEQQKLDSQLARGEGQSAEEQIRAKQLDDMLKVAKAQDPTQFAQAQGVSQMNELQLLDAETKDKLSGVDKEAETKKKDAAIAANKRLDESLAKLTQANIDLAAAEIMEKNAREEVVTALEALSSRQEDAYKAQRSNTAQHVNSEIADVRRLGAELDALASKYAKVNAFKSDPSGVGTTQYRAAGGSIFGPMGTDTVPAMLTPGEFVHRTAAVRHYGLPFMEAINSLRLPRFATGGQVSKTYHNERTAHVVQHFNHAILSDPSMQKYHIRMALR